MKKILTLALTIILVLTFFSGCTKKNAKPGEALDPMPKIDMSGFVLEVSENGDSILVDALPIVKDGVSGEIWVSITDTTNFYENSRVTRDFKVGNYVEIILDGPVAESDPMQGTADAIFINEPGDESE